MLFVLGLAFAAIAYGAFSQESWFLAKFALIPLGLFSAVVAQWLSHPMGVKDWTQGGVVWSDCGPDRVSWCDWAIFMTRRGSADLISAKVEVERYCFFGIFPLPGYECSFDGISQLQLKRHEVHNEGNLQRYDYKLVATLERGASRVLIDLAVGTKDSAPGHAFMETLETSLGGLFARHQARLEGSAR